MKTNLRVFINFKLDHWAKFLKMAKFAYNNIKNTNTGYILFELNYNSHPQASYEKYVDPYSKSKSVNKLATKL